MPISDVRDTRWYRDCAAPFSAQREWYHLRRNALQRSGASDVGGRKCQRGGELAIGRHVPFGLTNNNVNLRDTSTGTPGFFHIDGHPELKGQRHKLVCATVNRTGTELCAPAFA